MAQSDLKEARYWEPLERGRVRCLLCPHECVIQPDQKGICRVRQNVGGSLRTLNYGRVSAVNMDPIEKKPLFHFYPGAPILSLGTIGCNFSCAFCQNWSIAEGDVPTRRLLPEEALDLATRDPSNLGIAYTYNEPIIWYEFVLETARLVREAGLKNVLVTNGYISEDPLRELLPYVDAMNVDVKAMNDRFYRRLCRGTAEPPRRTVEMAWEAGCVVEVTNLIIPNWNDDEEGLRELIDWVASVNPSLPLHFSRYHPAHKLTEPPTPRETLFKAREMAMEKLRYVYVGNMWDGEGENTYCPSCGRTVIERRGFAVQRVSVKEGRCEFCGGDVAVVGT